MLLLEQEITRKVWVSKKIPELDAGNSKKYKMEAICNSAVYAKKSEDYLPGLYYLVT